MALQPTVETAPGCSLVLKHSVGRGDLATPVVAVVGWTDAAHYRVLQASEPGRIRDCDSYWGRWRSDLELAGGRPLLGSRVGTSQALVYADRASADAPPTLTLWDVDKGSRLTSLPVPEEPVCALVVASEGRVAVVQAGASVFVYRLPGGERVAVVQALAPVALSVGGGRIVALSLDRTRLLVVRTDGSLVAEIPCPKDATVTAVGMNRDGSEVVAGMSDGTRACWGVSGSEFLWRTTETGPAVVALARSPVGPDWFVLDAGGELRLCSGPDVDRWRGSRWRSPIDATPGLSSNPQIAPSLDGRVVAVVLPGGAVRVFRGDNGQAPGFASNREEWGVQLAVSTDGRLVASGGVDGAVRVTDVLSGEALWRFEVGAEEVTSVEFLPDGSGLRTCGSDRVVRRWSLRTGREESSAPFEGKRRALRARARGSLDGSRVLVSDGDTLELWSDQIPDRVAWRYVHDSGAILGECFCDNESQVLLVDEGMNGRGSFMPRCWVLDAATGEWAAGKHRFFTRRFCTLQETLRGPLSLSQGPHGRARIAAFDLQVVEEWTPRRRQTFPGPPRQVEHARFSTDGERLVTASVSHVDVYRLLPEAAWLGTIDLSPWDDPIATLATSRDGSVIAVGTRRGQVLVFACEVIA